MVQSDKPLKLNKSSEILPFINEIRKLNKEIEIKEKIKKREEEILIQRLHTYQPLFRGSNVEIDDPFLTHFFKDIEREGMGMDETEIKKLINLYDAKSVLEENRGKFYFKKESNHIEGYGTESIFYIGKISEKGDVLIFEREKSTHLKNREFSYAYINTDGKYISWKKGFRRDETSEKTMRIKDGLIHYHDIKGDYKPLVIGDIDVLADSLVSVGDKELLKTYIAQL